MNKIKILMKKFIVSMAVVYVIYFALELLRKTNVISELNLIYLYYEIAFMVLIGLSGMAAIAFGIYMVLDNAKKPLEKKVSEKINSKI